MATPRYRIIDENGIYAPRQPHVVLLQLGTEHADSHVLSIRAPVFERILWGEEIDFDGTPSQAMEPINDEAKAAMAAYLSGNRHTSLDPTSSLGLHGGGGLSVNDLILQQMDRLLHDAETKPAASAPSAELAALRELVGDLASQVKELMTLAARTPVRKS